MTKLPTKLQDITAQKMSPFATVRTSHYTIKFAYMIKISIKIKILKSLNLFFQYKISLYNMKLY
jgi:hypothetical protein